MLVAEQMMGFEEDEAATSKYLSARIGSSIIAKAALVEEQKPIIDFLGATTAEKPWLPCISILLRSLALPLSRKYACAPSCSRPHSRCSAVRSGAQCI
jgi:hypothetical protein